MDVKLSNAKYQIIITLHDYEMTELISEIKRYTIDNDKYEQEVKNEMLVELYNELADIIKNK